MGQLKQREDQREIDNRRLRAIRRGCDMASRDWIIVAANGATTLSTQSPDGVTTIATFDKGAPTDDQDFLMRAPEAVFFLLRLLDESYDEIRRRPKATSQPNRTQNSPPQQQTRRQANDDSKDFAANCAMLCAETAFGLFMIDRYQMQPPASETKVADCVRKTLKIGSRSELNTSTEAAKNWIGLRAEYEAWMRT